MSPLAILGVDMKFSRRVRLALPEATREVIRVVPSSDLVKGALEMLCRSVVVIQLGYQDRYSHAGEISRLEHELAEASDHLKQSLAVNSDPENEVYQGRIMPIADMKAWVRQQSGLTKEKEDEDHED